MSKTIRSYLILARPWHWIKNIFVLLPLFFGRYIYDACILKTSLFAFLSFCFISSAVYCVNDVFDKENDRINPAKNDRPVASGDVSVRGAVVFASILLLLSLIFAFFSFRFSWIPWVVLISYLIINLLYSAILKNYPIVDVCLLSSGYYLRLLFGSTALELIPSRWLALTVIAASFFLGLGKRRGEYYYEENQRRKVIELYNERFLTVNTYVFMALIIIFYALWSVDTTTTDRFGNDYLIWTVPIVIVICLRYSYDLEVKKGSDPVDILLKDKILFVLALILAIAVYSIIYIIH